MDKVLAFRAKDWIQLIQIFAPLTLRHYGAVGLRLLLVLLLSFLCINSNK